MLDFRQSLINSTLRKVLKRLHYPLEVITARTPPLDLSSSGVVVDLDSMLLLTSTVHLSDKRGIEINKEELHFE